MRTQKKVKEKPFKIPPGYIVRNSYVGEGEIEGNIPYKYAYPVPQKGGGYKFLYRPA